MSEEGTRQYIFESAVNSTFLVVNNAVVDIALSDVVGVSPLEDAQSNIYFTYGDNVFIESIRFQLPYSFGNGADTSDIKGKLGFRDFNGNNGVIAELGTLGEFALPSFNIDFPINTLIKQPSTVDSKWSFEIISAQGRVSMLNVPAALNAATIHGRFYINVRTTLPRVP